MTDILNQLSDSMAHLIEEAGPSVLRVDARRRLPATGIAWSENLLLTAHHVVEREEGIRVGLADGAHVDAELLGRDPRNDLALLRVDGELNPANWAAEDTLRVGQLALALGRPGQSIKASMGIVRGIASPADIGQRLERVKRVMTGEHKRGKRRRARIRIERFGEDFEGPGWMGPLANGAIQTDLTMYPGFSGGPLLGADGAVHGMTTSGFAQGASIAVPVAALRPSVAALLAEGKIQSGYLGVGLQEAQLPASVADSLEQEAGLLIVSIEADSPAARAGWLVGDILTELHGEALEEVDELLLLLSRIAVGSELKTRFVRGGLLQEGSVVVGSK